MNRVAVGEIPSHLRGEAAILLRKLGFPYRLIERALRLRRSEGMTAYRLIRRSSSRKPLAIFHWLTINGLDVGAFTASTLDAAPEAIESSARHLRRAFDNAPLTEQHTVLREIWRLGLSEREFWHLCTGQGLLEDRHSKTVWPALTRRKAASRILGKSAHASKAEIHYFMDRIRWEDIGKRRPARIKDKPTIINVGPSGHKIRVPSIYFLRKEEWELESLRAIKAALLARKRIRYDWQQYEV